MATVETWATEKLSEYTAIYPFVGTEWVWLIVAVVFWLWWHVKTSAKENVLNILSSTFCIIDKII